MAIFSTDVRLQGEHQKEFQVHVCMDRCPPNKRAREPQGHPAGRGGADKKRERQGEAVVMTATSVTCVVMTAISVALGSARFSTHLHTSRWMTMQALADQQLELLKKAVDAGQCTTGENSLPRFAKGTRQATPFFFT